MKETVRRMTADFDLPNLLRVLREEKELSYQEISNYFSALGYPCSRKLIERLFEKI